MPVCIGTPAQIEHLYQLFDLLKFWAKKGRRLPNETVLREVVHVGREDAAVAECRDERHAIATIIVRYKIAICCDNRSEIIAESHVDGRTIVECPDAHIEHLISNLSRLHRQPASEIVRDHSE